MLTYGQSEHTLDDIEDLVDEENVADKSVAIMVIQPPLKTVPKEKRQKALKVAWLASLENVVTKATAKFMGVAAVFPPLEKEAKDFYETWSEEVELLITKINNTKGDEAVKVIDFKKSEEEEGLTGDSAMKTARKIVIQGCKAVSKIQAAECKICGGYDGHSQCPAKDPTTAKRQREEEGGPTTFCTR
jgi:hypothetical protein